MRLIDADKFKCILPCNKEFHHIINHARTVKAIPLKDIEKMRTEIEQLRIHKAQFLTSDNKVCIDSQEVLDIIDKYKAESEEER